MTRSSRKRIALAICAYALLIVPPHKRALAEAMLAECDYVSDGDALGFAAGCFYSAVGWWLATAEGVTQSARLAIATGTAALALSALTVSFRAWVGGAQTVAWALVSIAVFYIVAALLASKIGLKAVARYSVAGLALNTLALMLQITVSSDTDSHGHYLRALVIEGYGLLALLIALTLGARWMAHRLETQH